MKVLGIKNQVKLVEIFTPEHRKPIQFKQVDHMLLFDMSAQPVLKGKQLTVRWSS